jgi:hypothetical protein
MLLTMTVAHGWHTKQIDFVQAFAQAPFEKTLYMKIPAGMELMDGSNPSNYALNIHINIYGQKQAGQVWNQYLERKLVKDLGFQQSAVDECLFYRGSTLYVLYTDDSLQAGPDKADIDKIIDKLQRQAKLSITVEGDLADFLGVSIDKRSDGTIHLSQPHLIDQILDDLRLNGTNVKSRSTPATSSKLLTRHLESEPFDNSFNYRSLIGKLNYLEKATRSDIAYTVKKCARFVSDPKKEHGDAVRWLGRYLLGIRDKGTIMQPMTDNDLEVFVDASFCGDWDPKEAATDHDTTRSRHGYIINYAGCPFTTADGSGSIVDGKRIHRSKLCPQRRDPSDGTVEGDEDKRLSNFEDVSPSTLPSIRGQQRRTRNGPCSQVSASDETPQRQASSLPGLRREKRD